MSSSVVDLIDVKTDDMTDYKKTSLLLVFPKCLKNCIDCQNAQLRNAEHKLYDIESIIELYNSLPEHQAVVCAGLDPIDCLSDLEAVLCAFNENTKPVDFIIYTGYYKNEIYSKIEYLSNKITNKNLKLIIKYGRYDKNNKNKYKSGILGVELVGNNQVVEQYTYNNNLIEIQKDSYCVQEKKKEENSEASSNEELLL